MQLHSSYYWFKSAISQEDCAKIIEMGKAKIAADEAAGLSTEAYTFGDQQKGAKSADAAPLDETPAFNADPTKETYIRDSKVTWLNDQWIYDLVYPLIKTANSRAGWNWQYDMSESFQFTEYNSPGGFYGWHKDGFSDWPGINKRYIHGITNVPLKANKSLPMPYVTDPKMVGKVRKISLTINLNSPGDYEGGNLKFDFGMHTDKEARFHECEEIRPQGSVIVFPSFVDHCVTPVTSGTRYSLVLWTLGDPWK